MAELSSISMFRHLLKLSGTRPPTIEEYDDFLRAARRDRVNLDSYVNSFTSSPDKFQDSMLFSSDELLRTLTSLTSDLWDMSFPSVVLTGTGLTRSQHLTILRQLQQLSDAVILMQRQILRITSAVNMMSSYPMNSSPSPAISCSNCSPEPEPPTHT